MDGGLRFYGNVLLSIYIDKEGKMELIIIALLVMILFPIIPAWIAMGSMLLLEALFSRWTFSIVTLIIVYNLTQ